MDIKDLLKKVDFLEIKQDDEVVGFGVGIPKHVVAQAYADAIYKKHAGNKKAHVWVCHRLKKGKDIVEGCKIGKCFKCKKKIVYDPACGNNCRKNAKKMCSQCVLSTPKYAMDLHDDQKEILRGSL